MKNPLKFLKHLWKDPINTIDEADARKKEIMPLLYGSLGVLVVFTILVNLIEFLEVVLTIPMFISFAFVGFCVFLLYMIKKAKQKFEALTCDKCKTLARFENKEQYEAHVSYIIKKRTVNQDTYIAKADNNGVVPEVRVRGEGKCDISIDLKCPNCGNIKQLEYKIKPFMCSASEKKVSPASASRMADSFKASVNSVLEDYLDDNKRKTIPYSIHSIHNPKYENRTKLTIGNDTVAYPIYKGVKIEVHRDAEEMVDGFFLNSELNGKIIDPNNPKKSK